MTEEITGVDIVQSQIMIAGGWQAARPLVLGAAWHQVPYSPECQLSGRRSSSSSWNALHISQE